MPGTPVIQGLGISIIQMFGPGLQEEQVLPGRLSAGGRVLQPGAQASLKGMGAGIQAGSQGDIAGKITGQLLKPQGFSPMTEQDLSQALIGMKQPANTMNLALAQAMVKSGIPLDLENLTTLQTALSRVPGKGPMDMAAACFLKANTLPVTPQNITILANFFSAHPMLGAQLFELQDGLRRLVKGEGKGKSEIPALITRYVLNPAEKPEMLKQALVRLARMAGMEKSDAKDQLQSELSRLQANIQGEEGWEELATILGKLLQNIQAQRLINQARPQESIGFYYLQVPLRLDEETPTMEFQVRYHVEEGGEKVVDPDNTMFEFQVEFEHLGRLDIKGEIHKSNLYLEIGTEMLEVAEFIRKHVPVLQDELEKLVYSVRKIEITDINEDEEGGNQAKEQPLERVDLEI
ncbi:MAG: hypothetical protein J7M18_05945 [Candidatus Eremiobacteraeota bacterium]|nr:hypothetical protein [Candidatus Eremiobacteraeota bacterium]